MRHLFDIQESMQRFPSLYVPFLPSSITFTAWVSNNTWIILYRRYCRSAQYMAKIYEIIVEYTYSFDYGLRFKIMLLHELIRQQTFFKLKKKSI